VLSRRALMRGLLVGLAWSGVRLGFSNAIPRPERVEVHACLVDDLVWELRAGGVLAVACRTCPQLRRG